MVGRVETVLGDLFGIKSLTGLLPGVVSGLYHRHSHQDEFIYVVEGNPTLFTDAAELQLH